MDRSRIMLTALAASGFALGAGVCWWSDTSPKSPGSGAARADAAGSPDTTSGVSLAPVGTLCPSPKCMPISEV